MDAIERTEVINAENTEADAGATALASASGEHICPRCHTPYNRDALRPPEYKCSCGLELAYPDISPSGEIKGVIGWLCSPGTIVHDRYRVVQILGRGGFGSTYLVEDMKLSNKRRALKEIPEQMYDEHESRILSKLNHPSIPDITDRAVGEGMVYMVLEFGGSRTLDSVRRTYPEKRVPLVQLAPWVRQLCDVLAYMHAQTPPIVHRDLKPGNILLDDQDRVMLIDFGIAKEDVASEQTRALGRAVTHGFSPPEQAMGTGTDARSDVYALGATIYYLLTGDRPPGAPERIQGKEIPLPSQIVAGLPPAIDRALLQSLSLNPNERQQSVREFGKAFDYDAATIKTYDMPEVSDRTIALGSATPTTRTSSTTPPPSLRLGPDGAQVIPTEAPVRRGGERAAIAASVLALVAAVAVAGYVFMKPKADKSEAATVLTTPAPSVEQAPAVAPAPLPPTATAPAVVEPTPTAAPVPAPQTTAAVQAAPVAPAPVAPAPTVAPAEEVAAAQPPVATVAPTATNAPAVTAPVAPAATAPRAPVATVSPSPQPAETVATVPTAPAAATPPAVAPEPAPAVPAPPAEPAEDVVAKSEPAPKPKPAKKKVTQPKPVVEEPVAVEPEEPAATTSGTSASAWQKANQGATFQEMN
jgi:serine/threonine-protein kinase